MSANAFAVLDRVDPSLWLVTAQAGPRRGGLIATFVTSASIVPEMPRVLVGLARQHYTWDLVEASGAFTLHQLGERHLEWVWHFGLASGRGADKLAGLHVTAGKTGSPRLPDAPGWLECEVEARLETGDRTVYLAAVVDAGAAAPEPLLTTKRILELAPPEMKRRLKEMLTHDAAVDAAAIRAWRGGLTATPPPGGST
jgi:flavin reductase (DIM6/NTAB) family NADH-FMN oxidoreductase RutF